MASITITIPDNVLTRVLDAIAARNGYNSATDGTKAAFAKAIVIKWVRREVIDYEANSAGQTASTSTRTQSESDISLS